MRGVADRLVDRAVERLFGDVARADIVRWNPAESEVATAIDPIYAKRFAMFKALYRSTRELMAELDR